MEEKNRQLINFESKIMCLCFGWIILTILNRPSAIIGIIAGVNIVNNGRVKFKSKEFIFSFVVVVAFSMVKLPTIIYTILFLVYDTYLIIKLKNIKKEFKAIRIDMEVENINNKIDTDIERMSNHFDVVIIETLKANYCREYVWAYLKKEICKTIRHGDFHYIDDYIYKRNDYK